MTVLIRFPCHNVVQISRWSHALQGCPIDQAQQSHGPSPVVTSFQERTSKSRFRKAVEVDFFSV